MSSSRLLHTAMLLATAASACRHVPMTVTIDCAQIATFHNNLYGYFNSVGYEYGDVLHVTPTTATRIGHVSFPASDSASGLSNYSVDISDALSVEFSASVASEAIRAAIEAYARHGFTLDITSAKRQFADNCDRVLHQQENLTFAAIRAALQAAEMGELIDIIDIEAGESTADGKTAMHILIGESTKASAAERHASFDRISEALQRAEFWIVAPSVLGLKAVVGASKDEGGGGSISVPKVGSASFEVVNACSGRVQREATDPARPVVMMFNLSPWTLRLTFEEDPPTQPARDVATGASNP